ncbi:MAG TPA: DoxX family protein [Bacteroidia bacterium]|jgi:putative oxidoreductase|nr:DoxX family protein [Bacteroidia bacterium]
METIVKLNKWANENTNIGTDMLRVLFGAFIFYKGTFFLNQTDYLTELLPGDGTEGVYFILVHYVALAHICGGLFIIMGLLTRVCSLLQVPILIGAIAVNFTGTMDYFNIAQASAALAFCFCFLFYGSGRHSVDYALKLNM